MNVPSRGVHPVSWDEIHSIRDEFTKSLEAIEQYGQEIHSPLRMVGTTYGYRFCYDGLNDKDQRQRLMAFWRKVCPSLAHTAAHVFSPIDANKKIKIGFFSELMYGHTVGYFIKDLITKLDRDIFDVTVIYPQEFPQDQYTRQIEAAADQTIIVPFAIGPARQMIEAQQLDILFYPEIGMGPLTYFLAHARLARIQCTTWGHPITTGLPDIDYFISSKLIEPPDAQDHYSEKLVLLDDLPTTLHQPKFTRQGKASRADYGLPEHGRLYMCPQNLYKLHFEFDDYIKGILQEDPQGHFILNDRGNHQNSEALLKRFAQNLGPELTKRVHILPFVKESEFLDYLALGDVILDPIHFGSGRSGYEAICSGIPLITHPGEFMCGRVTLGIYHKIGLTEYIVDSKDAYIQKAVEVANEDDNKKRRAEELIKKTAALFNSDSSVTEITQFFYAAMNELRNRPEMVKKGL